MSPYPSYGSYPPPSPPMEANGWGRFVEHRLTTVEITHKTFSEQASERATKHGKEIDQLREELTKIRTYGLRLMYYALALAAAGIGHLTSNPTIKALADAIRGLKSALP